MYAPPEKDGGPRAKRASHISDWAAGGERQAHTHTHAHAGTQWYRSPISSLAKGKLHKGKATNGHEGATCSRLQRIQMFPVE